MNSVVTGDTHDPHAILGAHPTGGNTVIRTLRKGAKDGDHRRRRRPRTRWHGCTPDGVFAAELPGTVLDYRIDVDGAEVDDPYRHLPTLGELDLHLIGEGRHEKLWTVLGAQPGAPAWRSRCGRPSARGVQVVGDFAGWGAVRRLADAVARQQRRLGAVRPRTRASARGTSTRSWAGTATGGSTPTRWPQHTEVPPATASVVYESTLRVAGRRVAGRAGDASRPTRNR